LKCGLMKIRKKPVYNLPAFSYLEYTKTLE
jgi:hypothetical protein